MAINAGDAKSPLESVSKPYWILLYPGTNLDRVLTENIVTVSFRLTTGKEGQLVPLFEDKRMADRFTAAIGDSGKGMIPTQMEDFGAIEAMLKRLETKGITHVQFNAMPERPGEPITPIIPIAHVIVSIECRPK